MPASSKQPNELAAMALTQRILDIVREDGITRDEALAAVRAAEAFVQLQPTTWKNMETKGGNA